MTSHDPKPVAYMDKDGTLINDTTHPEFYVHLFTADALRAAQVQVLRDAADECTCVDDRAVILSIADELEAGK